MWRITLRCDVVKGQYNELLRGYVYHEVYFIVATEGEKSYIHYYRLREWEQANRLLKRILATNGFSPEGKPKLWLPLVDKKTIRPDPRRDWRWYLIERRR